MPTSQKTYETASEIITKYSDYKTAVFLSTDNTYKKLYELFVKDEKLIAGSVGQTDEVYGARKHRNSKELFVSNTGLIDYFANKNIRFYPMLETGDSMENVSKNYDEALRFILKYFPKSVGILGVGKDGNTAGIPAGIKGSREEVKRMIEDQSSFVSGYELEGLGGRITMNFHALSILDLIIILVLGQEKREALSNMFKDGEIEDCPARFYLRPEIAKKTILITDQNI